MLMQRLLPWILAGGFLLPAAGCLGRKETIKIARDGSVAMAIEYEGTRDELATQDALPSPATGWNVTTTEKEEGNDVKLTLAAERHFGPGAELPSTYGAPGDPDGLLYLAFPTTVWIEPRLDGVYYTFRRVYAARPWGYVKYWEEQFFDDSVKKLSEKPVEELTLDERFQIVEAFAGIEVFKQLEFAKAAMETSEPGLAPEHWLRARQAVLAYLENEADKFRSLIAACDPLAEEQRGACYEQEANRILNEGYAALIASLRTEGGFDESRIARLERCYAQEKRRYEITNQLGAHFFEIEVELPGELVANNAEKVLTDEGEHPARVQWQFDGRAFRDRPHELIAVSRVRPGMGEVTESQPDASDN